MKKFVLVMFFLLFVVGTAVASSDCGYKSDGQYHCGSNCGYKSDGKYHCDWWPLKRF